MAGKKIKLDHAKTLIKNHKDSPVNKDKLVHSIKYDASLIRELIDQPGCVAVRIFKAKNKVSDSSLDTCFVLVGVDAAGNNITLAKSTPPQQGTMAVSSSTNDAVILDEGEPCPDRCDGGQGADI